jgi:hypothetical protein
VDAADKLVRIYCGFCDDECGLDLFRDWDSRDISKLIRELDAELQRREHTKNVQGA